MLPKSIKERLDLMAEKGKKALDDLHELHKKANYTDDLQMEEPSHRYPLRLKPDYKARSAS